MRSMWILVSGTSGQGGLRGGHPREVSPSDTRPLVHRGGGQSPPPPEAAAPRGCIAELHVMAGEHHTPLQWHASPWGAPMPPKHGWLAGSRPPFCVTRMASPDATT